MPLRTSPDGYGLVAKALHWVTVAALTAQLVIGYSMDWDDSGHGHGRGRGRGGDGGDGDAGGDDSGHGRGRGGGDDASAGLGDDPLVAVHVGLGLTILSIGLLRILWRRLDSLPAWDDRLSDRDRRWAPRIERTLLALLLLIPLTGLPLVLTGEDDLVPLHVATHLAFFAALAAHVGLVLRRGLLRRML